MAKIVAVDLFCGAGGLAHGLMRSGIQVAAGFDLDESCRYAFERNNQPARFFAVDVKALPSEFVTSLLPKKKIKILAGCAPCQPFSTYSLGKTEKNDSKWGLLLEFGRIVKETKPEIVTMENVPKLVEHSVFNKFCSQLKRLGYHVSYKIIDCEKYGIPQTRKRLVLLASQFGPISLRPPDPKKDKIRTVRQAIGRMEKISAAGVSRSDRLHRASGVSEINLKRLRASRPGGTWHDWDKSLVANCHQTKRGHTFVSVYGRMAWDSPGPTITTQFFGFGNGRFGHPEQDRAISLREGAILQTFPSTYRFIQPQGPVHFTTIGRMIGNAVPVKLGEVIGESILDHIHKKTKSNHQNRKKSRTSQKK